MKTNLKRFLAVLALALPIAFVACNKDGVEPEQPINEMTTVKLSFTDTVASPKLPGEGSKIDLSKAALVKIEYTINDGSVQPQAIREAELIVTGDSSKTSTIDRRVLTFKGGSTFTILSAVLFDSEGQAIGTSPVPDTFEVSSPKGTVVMERSYGVSSIER